MFFLLADMRQSLFPSREWRLVHVDVHAEERQLHELQVKTLIEVSG